MIATAGPRPRRSSFRDLATDLAKRTRPPKAADMPRDLLLFEALHLAWQAECLPPRCRPSLDRLVQQLLLGEGRRVRDRASVAAMNRYLRFRIHALSRDN